MKRLILVWVLILCLIPLNAWGDNVMNDFHYAKIGIGSQYGFAKISFDFLFRQC